MNQFNPQAAAANAAAHSNLLSMIAGGWLSQALHVVARLNLADLLDAGPATAGSLARQTGADEGALKRVMRALVSVGVFDEQPQGHYALTPMSELLRSTATPSLRDYASMAGSEWVWRSWGEMMHSVTTGQPAFDSVYGAPIFTYATGNPQAQKTLVAGLASRSDVENSAILDAYDFSSARTVVDVGGGRGSLLARILQQYPHLKGVLMDTADVTALARESLHAAGVLGRCELVSGNFFEQVPSGDVMLMKKVIHDWSDDDAVRILSNCRKALRQDSRLLLLEAVVPAGNGPAFAKLIDLLMLVLAGGRERTEAEYQALCARAGLDLHGVIQTPPIGILEIAPQA